MARSKKSPVIEEVETIEQPLPAEFKMVPLGKILPNRSNPRKVFDSHDMAELVKSVKLTKGIIQPILIRPSETDILLPEEFAGPAFELVCGERRFQATMEAGYLEIPAVIRHLTDDEAFELSITENLQRKNVNLMEESDAFHALIGRGLSSAEQIADKLGVSTKYIYDRLALQKLLPDIQDKIRRHELSITHGKQFARLNLVDQQKLWNAHFDSDAEDQATTISELKHIINNTFTLKLSKAAFDTNDAKLVKAAGACSSCPKRSGCDLLLFDDIQDKDICFDKSCYDAKALANIEKQLKLYEKKGSPLFKLSANWQVVNKDWISSGDWSEIKEGENADEFVFGIIVDLNKWQNNYTLGQIIKIHPIENEDDEEHEGESAASTGISSLVGNASAGGPKSQADHIDWDDEMIKACTAEAITLFNSGSFPGVDLNKMVIDDLIKNFDTLSENTALQLCDAFEWEKIYNKNRDDLDQAATIKNVIAVGIQDLYPLARLVDLLSDSLENWCWDRDDIEKAIRDFTAVGLDFRAIVSEVNVRAGTSVIDFDVLDYQD